MLILGSYSSLRLNQIVISFEQMFIGTAHHIILLPDDEIFCCGGGGGTKLKHQFELSMEDNAQSSGVYQKCPILFGVESPRLKSEDIAEH